MKKAIRILFPLLLAVAIILCTAWYLFVYDRDFTRDMLLSCARYCESQGNHTIAATFYDLAYSHAGDNDAVAIELADQYKSSGNYTKAEYTLSNAIADGGGVELYIALCKTYVEQDKLMDAVNMLNNITNPEIKSQLDALRPKAPTAAPEPGFYSQYILADIATDNGTLYVTTDGEYPSTENAPYAEAIQLVEGENTIYALSVADNGLVSPLATFGYIVGGVIEEVSFADPAFEAAVRGVLEISEDEAIFTNTLWDITAFTVPADAASYADLKYLPYLESLNIDNGISGELQNISSLSNLSELNISNTTVTESDLTKIAALPMLKKLTLQNCGISSIAELSAAKNLVTLDLGSNSIRNLSPLASMKNLQELDLQHNAVTDLSDLATVSTLTKLDVSYNALTSIAPISSLSGLTWLNAGTNSIADIGELNKLSSLTYLVLSHNSITDISKAASCTALTELDISNNALTDITALETLVNLMYLNFSYNQVTALPALPADCALVTIDGTQNLLESIDSLGGLEALNNVYMDYNEEISSVEALASCPVLIQVNVYGTKVTDVSSLTNQSVIVNYNPVQEEG